MWLRHAQSDQNINLRFSIETEIVDHIRNQEMLVTVGRGRNAKHQTLTVNCALIKATIRDTDGRILAQDYKQETSNDFPDYLEKATTGAIGRAIAQLGYGTQWAMEFEGEVEADRLHDGPVQSDSQPPPDQDRRSTQQTQNQAQNQAQAQQDSRIKPAQANAILSMMKELEITQQAFIERWGSLREMTTDFAETVISDMNIMIDATKPDAPQGSNQAKQAETGKPEDDIFF